MKVCCGYEKLASDLKLKECIEYCGQEYRKQSNSFVVLSEIFQSVSQKAVQLSTTLSNCIRTMANPNTMKKRSTSAQKPKRQKSRVKQSCYRGVVSKNQFLVNGLRGQRGGFGSKSKGVVG